MSVRINGVGSSLVDYLYTGVDFGSEAFRAVMSKRPGDGGLVPGALTLVSDLEAYTGRSLEELLPSLVGERKPDGSNVGGPAVVALLHAAQLCEGSETEVSFFGVKGSDETARQIERTLSNTPLHTSGYESRAGRTPVTYVLSDPSYANGNGERTFINDIGVAGTYYPGELPAHFYDADVAVFGGTALVPRIHDGLTELLKKAKAAGALTVVNTVYDFPNQQRHPQARWPLGESDESYRFIDLLLCDREEALRLSGEDEVDAALKRFSQLGAGAAVITQGAEDTLAYAGSTTFEALRPTRFPVSRRVSAELAAGAGMNGDTTGCGDNFAGGVIAAIAGQLERGSVIDLRDALAWGTVSGGYACFYMGGTFSESAAGEKRALLEPYYRAYRSDQL